MGGMKRPSVPTITVIVVNAVLLCYVLSIGPAARMADQRTIGVEAVHALYSPVLGAARRYHPVRELVVNYCEFWTGKASSYPFSSSLRMTLPNS
jgi:hypothetical protein